MRLVVYGGLLFAGYIASAVYADSQVRRTAADFCYELQAGYDVDAVEHDAIALGATALEPRWVFQAEDKTLKLDLFFAGLPPFDGYTCSLFMRDDQLIRKQFSVVE